MLVGLLGKNAILIIEFAVQRRHEGLSIRDAGLEGGKLRFRPILMTSFAFNCWLDSFGPRNGPRSHRQPHHWHHRGWWHVDRYGGRCVGNPRTLLLFAKMVDGRKLIKMNTMNHSVNSSKETNTERYRTQGNRASKRRALLISIAALTVVALPCCKLPKLRNPTCAKPLPNSYEETTLVPLPNEGDSSAQGCLV